MAERSSFSLVVQGSRSEALGGVQPSSTTQSHGGFVQKPALPTLPHLMGLLSGLAIRDVIFLITKRFFIISACKSPEWNKVTYVELH